jgi:hypothetical protein
MIMDSQDESDFDDQRNTDYPIKYLSMVAGQRDYSIPVSEHVLSIKRVDVTYDGVNFYRAEPIDSGELVDGMGRMADSTQETNNDALFSKTAPRYDVKYNSVFIYPRADATDVANSAKLKIEWSREATEFTTAEFNAGTVIPGFDSAFHPMLALGPSYDYCLANALPQAKALDAQLKELEIRLRRQYGQKQKDRDYQLVPAYNNFK